MSSESDDGQPTGLLGAVLMFVLVIPAYIFGIVSAVVLVPLIPVPEWATFTCVVVIAACAGSAFFGAGVYLLHRRQLL